jgi:TPR repeat protein
VPVPFVTAPVSSAPVEAQAPSAAAQPTSPATAYASLDTQPAMAALKANPPAVAPQPALSELRPIDRDELAGLLKRGQVLLAEGDIASARLLLRRAAEAGDANAALMLAGTYDRAELSKLRVIGVVHDHAQAKLWYTRAVEHGSAEAVRRLQQLAQRAD